MSTLGSRLLRTTIIGKDTPIHKLDPRTKFLYFFWISLLGYIFYDFVLTFIFLVVNLLLAVVGKVVRRILLTILVIIVPWIAIAAPILSLPLGFPWNETIIYRINLFGMELPVYQEGLGWAITWPLRIAVTISAALLFMLTTKLGEIIALFFKLRLPFRALYMIAAALQFIPLLADEVGTIYQAQLSRGLKTKASIVRRVFNFLALGIPLTLSAISKVQIRAIALESRGFSAPVEKTLMYELRFKSVDYVFFAAIIFFTGVLAYIYITMGYSPIVRLRYLFG